MVEMKDPDKKKCPRCGAPLKPDKPCERCARTEGVEVEFKDFKISELLDIKMPARKKAEEPEEKK